MKHASFNRAASHPFSSLERDLNQLFASIFQPSEAATAQAWQPLADVSETEAGYTIVLDLPGVAKEDLKVSLKDQVLKVEGERKAAQAEANYHRQERFLGHFAREFRFSEALQQEAIKAQFAHGVLRLEIPKAAKPAPIQIEIQ